MGFLEADDYKGQIKLYDLDDLTDFDDSTRKDCELHAQSFMEGYLSEKFNVGEIFAATGDNRHPLIKMYMIDLVLYELFGANPRMAPEQRTKRFDTAVKWLDMVRKGTLSVNLPALTNKEGDTTIDSTLNSERKNRSDLW